MSELFETLKLGRIELENRIVMAPMTRCRADDEGVQPGYVAEYYAQRAGAGLIITEATNVSPMAKGYMKTPGIYTEAQTDSWRPVTRAVHENGGKIFLQIFHTGRIALPDFLPEGSSRPLAPSAVRAKGQNITEDGMKDFVTPKPMTEVEIEETVADFGRAAANAIEAGFDGVELHGANGYLVQQFLAGNVNHREDRYGGSVENRSRFALEVIDSIIKAVGSERTGIRLSPGGVFNDIREGDSEELYDYLVGELNDRELAYLHIGTTDEEKDWHPVIRPRYKGKYIASVGFDRSSGQALIEKGGADAVAYGKLFISNPDLPLRFKEEAQLAEWDESTFYQGGRNGYVDYPALGTAQAA
ncbi:MAG: alkene reductase [Acidobacteria bacterium]|nr:MAG: alkene reductase [Acidobacteriota bacterium]REK01951.1 MAG: alkene reductase [Acidobacteriota bacterium]REK14907.1 MAG: alkene reductase [Acidobacteriota bacterium]REK45622.1 MAG: alkene reductase [Acidobacteriota bacterium]